MSLLVASNPFCTRFVRPGAITFRFPPSQDRGGLASIVDQLFEHHAGLIVGPHGSGKTTLLHTIGPLLSDRFLVVANLQLIAPTANGFLSRFRHARNLASMVRSQHAKLADGGLLVIDGAEQLLRFDLRRLLQVAQRRNQFVLATSHRPILSVPVLYQTSTDSEVVQSIARSLVRDASPEVTHLIQQQLRSRDWSTLTNVRDLWFELYDLVEPHLASNPPPSEE